MIFHRVDFGLSKHEFYLDMLDTPKSMKERSITIGYKGGMMLEIWINGNSMMSLSNHVLVWYQEKEERQYNDGFKNARKLDVGIMIRPPDDEFQVYK